MGRRGRNKGGTKRWREGVRDNTGMKREQDYCKVCVLRVFIVKEEV